MSATTGRYGITWAEAERMAREARDRCRKSDGKDACHQWTCPRCNQFVGTPRTRR